MTRIRPDTLAPWTLMLLLIASGIESSSVFAQAGEGPGLTRSMQRFLEDREPVQDLAPMAETLCVNGFAGPYPCNSVDLMAFMPINTIGGGSGADIWGWTDPVTNKEYALMARSSGISFVDISDPVNPIYLGNLPTSTFATTWRDVDVYADHAFIVADLAGNHGMQVFDLTQLRDVSNPPVTFSETTHYSGFKTAHTVTIDSASGFAYAAGSDTCNGGLHMVNIQNPIAPTFAGATAATAIPTRRSA